MRLQESLWAGDTSKFTRKVRAEWSTIATGTHMESLDYDVVDNRAFRSRGKHNSALSKLTVTFLIGAWGDELGG